MGFVSELRRFMNGLDVKVPWTMTAIKNIMWLNWLV